MESKGWTNTTKDMYIRDGVMVKAPRRKATGNNISICFPSKNVLSVCHSNLEPAAQWYTQTEQVYSFARTLFSKMSQHFCSRGRPMRARQRKIRGNIARRPKCTLTNRMGV